MAWPGLSRRVLCHSSCVRREFRVRIHEPRPVRTTHRTGMAANSARTPVHRCGVRTRDRRRSSLRLAALTLVASCENPPNSARGASNSVRLATNRPRILTVSDTVRIRTDVADNSLESQTYEAVAYDFSRGRKSTPKHHDRRNSRVCC